MFKKLAAVVLAVAIAAFGVLPAYAVDLNNFVILNYDIKFQLGRDEQQRSTLKTTETIVAEFPNFDQNHGIERYIPKKYDGHSTSLKVISIKDQNGQDRNYTTYDSGDYTVLRIGDADRYVQGQQTYKIEYALADVTKYFSDTGRDEFYWDTTGTEWQVPIENLNLTLSVDKSLQAALSGQPQCYVGGFGSNQTCSVVKTDNVFTASASNLGAHQNISLAIGFNKATFGKYVQPPLQKLLTYWIFLQIGLGVAALILLIWLLVKFQNLKNRKGEMGTVVAEYLPPKDASVTMSAQLITSNSSTSAQLIDLAVRHYLKIYELKPKSFFTKGKYQLEIAKPVDDLRSEEKEILSDLFKGKLLVGAKLSTNDLRKDFGLSSRLTDNAMKFRNLARKTYDLRTKPPANNWFKKTAKIMLLVAVILLSPPLLFVAIVAFIQSFVLWPLTDKGLALKRYLEGLKLYIKVAEVDRLKMLQSPEGAAKVQVDASDPKQLVKLYERVLPYAVLFGQEKEWNKKLGNYYEQTQNQPDWYVGHNLAAFNAASFAGAMSGLTSSISSSGAASSSSGGSGGGGFSGGGGGGGGGGGW